MSVGRFGGIGVLKLDGGLLTLSGQHTGNNGAGANLSIGLGGGTGVATADHGSVITLTNMGSAGTSLNLGGTTNYPSGDGSLNLAGGSQIKLIAAPNRAAVTVGRDDSAFHRSKHRHREQRFPRWKRDDCWQCHQSRHLQPGQFARHDVHQGRFCCCRR